MKRLLSFTIALLIAGCVFAQAPQKMSYQCVVRNSAGNLVTNQSVGLKISIRQGSASGTVIFSETYSPAPQTNANGLVMVEIGSGTASTGSFNGIDWSTGPYFLETQTDPTGGNNYSISGTSQLLSVPYALYAKSAGNGFSGNYNDLINRPILFSGNYNDLTNRPTLFDGTWSGISGKPTTLAGYGIADAMTTAHAANNITSSNITNWNAAFGWGNHSGLYRSVSYVPGWAEVTNKPTTLNEFGITDGMSTSHAANNVTATNITNWNAAFGWGNHTGLYRPITYVPAWSEVSSKPTTLAGYGITNGMSTSHPSNAITTTNITNWTTAFGWGNHATAGYAVLPTLTNNSGKFLTNNGTSISWGTLATVATTGSYNDLLNKPTIPQPMPNGSNAGDMLYWNGTTWVSVPVGSAGQILQLSASKVPTWGGPQLPTISTNAITSLLANSAVSGGNISSDGGSAVTLRGVCWNTSGSPTTANSKTENGSGTGTFTSTINGLSPSTLYYVRAYAVNIAGTSYGDQKTFTTTPIATDPQGSIFNPNLNYGSVTDIDGNTYKTIQIGTQTWMAENLKTLRYNDGTSIPQINQSTVEGDPGYLAYGDVNTFGLLYNWYAVSVTTNGGKNVCPTGWHVPNDEEWILMEGYLGNNGYNYDGTIGGLSLYAELWRNKIAKALSSATLIWIQSVNVGAIGNEDFPDKRNASGFSALPGGLGLSVNGFTGSLNSVGYFWTSSSALTTLSWSRTFINAESFNRRTAENKSWQFSVRCLKD